LIMKLSSISVMQFQKIGSSLINFEKRWSRIVDFKVGLRNEKKTSMSC